MCRALEMLGGPKTLSSYRIALGDPATVAAFGSEQPNLTCYMLTCPHCGQPTNYPFAAEFNRVDAGRLICGHCKKEFFVLDNVPLTKRQYAARIKVQGRRAG
jgi:transposase-like protein